MAKRVNIDGPSDNPEEYWFECLDCGGEGELLMNEGTEGEEWGECPTCDGTGCTEGDASDL